MRLDGFHSGRFSNFRSILPIGGKSFMPRQGITDSIGKNIYCTEMNFRYVAASKSTLTAKDAF
jgi:hypothetical protein